MTLAANGFPCSSDIPCQFLVDGCIMLLEIYVFWIMVLAVQSVVLVIGNGTGTCSLPFYSGYRVVKVTSQSEAIGNVDKGIKLELLKNLCFVLF